MLKRRGNNRFHVVSTWNTHGLFLGKFHTGIHGCVVSVMVANSLVVAYKRYNLTDFLKINFVVSQV